MTRNLKVLGLALVAAFAMSAVAASGASATAFNFKSAGTPTNLTGVQHAGNDKFVTHGGTVECNHATYSGSVTGTSVAEVTVTPTYTGCKAFFFINVPIDTNGCGYLFTTGTKEGANFEGSVHIECPTGATIQVTAPGCEVTVEAQTPTGGKVTFTNIGAAETREVTVDVALTGIHYTEHEKSGAPNCESETTTTTNGTYNGSAVVTGTNPATGVHRGVWVE